MKYLKYFESFYSPALQVYKGNLGTDKDNDAGFNTTPFNSFSINDEKKAFDKGEEDFGKGLNLDNNPYLGQQYPNSALIKAWTEGWNTGNKNKNIKENVYVGLDGSLNYPEYLVADYDDTLDTAFYKGEEAFNNGCELEENPFLYAHEDMATAWSDGWMNSEHSHKNSIQNN